eukprot:TRINITY_DN401_c0_g1_i4.p1 TRINITY_DN401_c0_g1~~TRINITY_DN401_c0_g1_i4.p1  ORF type:complete len:630 (-),score=139.78 TRINITY_DN401_c0_g1_i4:111-2000(-)
MERVNDPISVVEMDETGDRVVMVSLLPTIPTAVESATTEMIFLVDRSGSMGGSRISQAKNALQLFLRSLKMGTYFNIVSFGSSFVKLFPRSVVYSDTSFSSAKDHVAEMSANLGGTNVLAPLTDILSSPCQGNLARQIFFLTDGEVSNTAEVILYTKQHAGSTRIFSFGISADASPYLVNGVAKASRGKAEFIQSGVRLELKVMTQLRRALQPVFTNVKVNWGALTVQQSPSTPPPIFHSDRFLVYGHVETGKNDGITSTLVSISADKGPTPAAITSSVNVDLKATTQGTLVHKLAARTQIRELDTAGLPANKSQIISLGLKHGLASRYTSFVAVEQRDSPAEGTLQVRKIEAFASVEPHKPVIIDTIHSMGYRWRTDTHTTDLLQGHQLSAAPQQSVMPQSVLLCSAPKAKKGGGFGFTLPSISLPSISSFLPSFGLMSAAKESAPHQPEPPREPQLVYYGTKSEGNRFINWDDEDLSPTPATTPSTAAAAAPTPPVRAASAVGSSSGGVPTHEQWNAQARPLDRVVFLQNSDGSWVMTDTLAAVLLKGGTSVLLTSQMPTELKSHKDASSIWATALAMTWLELSCSSDKIEWEILHSKAGQWLHSHLAGGTLLAAALITAAKSSLGL